MQSLISKSLRSNGKDKINFYGSVRETLESYTDKERLREGEGI